MRLKEDLSLLVVDDSEVMRQSLATGLRTLGYRHVALVPNGKVALEYVAAHPVDIVVSDWYMDPVNGFELLQLVRANARLAPLVFVMISGETAKDKIVEAIKAGVDGYVVKPFTFDVLALQLQEAIKRRIKE